MIDRRPKSVFMPRDVEKVRRKFHKIVRKAAQKAELAPKPSRPPLKPPTSPFVRLRKSA